MPGQGRLGDQAQVAADTHGCPGCPHPGVGRAVIGSTTVMVNGRPALRAGDSGTHSACCGGNTWSAVGGSATVFINGKAAHRISDQTQHCGGIGQLVEGSADVIVGDGGGAASPGAGGASGAPAVPAPTASRQTTPSGQTTPPPASMVTPELVAVDEPAQIIALRAAAADGLPFCEECERLRSSR